MTTDEFECKIKRREIDLCGRIENPLLSTEDHVVRFHCPSNIPSILDRHSKWCSTIDMAAASKHDHEKRYCPGHRFVGNLWTCKEYKDFTHASKYGYVSPEYHYIPVNNASLLERSDWEALGCTGDIATKYLGTSRCVKEDAIMKEDCTENDEWIEDDNVCARKGVSAEADCGIIDGYTWKEGVCPKDDGEYTMEGGDFYGCGWRCVKRKTIDRMPELEKSGTKLKHILKSRVEMEDKLATKYPKRSSFLPQLCEGCKDKSDCWCVPTMPKSDWKEIKRSEFALVNTENGEEEIVFPQTSMENMFYTGGVGYCATGDPNPTWTAASCSDGLSTTKEECEGNNQTWAGASCSDELSKTKEDCENSLVRISSSPKDSCGKNENKSVDTQQVLKSGTHWGLELCRKKVS